MNTHCRTLVGILLALLPMTAWAGELPGKYYQILSKTIEQQQDQFPRETVTEPPPPRTWMRYPGLLLAAAFSGPRWGLLVYVATGGGAVAGAY